MPGAPSTLWLPVQIKATLQSPDWIGHHWSLGPSGFSLRASLTVLITHYLASLVIFVALLHLICNGFPSSWRTRSWCFRGLIHRTTVYMSVRYCQLPLLIDVPQSLSARPCTRHELPHVLKADKQVSLHLCSHPNLLSLKPLPSKTQNRLLNIHGLTAPSFHDTPHWLESSLQSEGSTEGQAPFRHKASLHHTPRLSQGLEKS